MKIRLCHHNQGADQLLQRLLDQYPGLDAKLKKCVKQCKTCKKQPLAVYDHVMLTAASVDELYGKLQKLIEKQAGQYVL